VLSKFTGAAVELRDALIVNPYDVAGVAEAIHEGLEMSRAERRTRMQRMRRHIMDHNVYRWAANVLGDLHELRMENAEPAETRQPGVFRFPRQPWGSVNWRRREVPLTPDAAERQEAFFAAFGAAARPLLLVDYDGTLAPFRVNRFEARPFSGVRELLSHIQKQKKTRMVVITGRPAGEIASMLGSIRRLRCGGCTERSGSIPMVGMSCNWRRRPRKPSSKS